MLEILDLLSGKKRDRSHFSGEVFPAGSEPLQAEVACEGAVPLSCRSNCKDSLQYSILIPLLLQRLGDFERRTAHVPIPEERVLCAHDNELACTSIIRSLQRIHGSRCVFQNRFHCKRIVLKAP